MDWWDDWSDWSNFGDMPAPEDDPLVLPTVTVVGQRIEKFDWFLWSLMYPDPLLQPIAWPQEDWASGVEVGALIMANEAGDLIALQPFF